MADYNSSVPNGTSSASNSIPSGTNLKSESQVLEALKAVNARNFDTLADVALTGVKGEPLDDKTYLMERIIQLTAELPLHDRVSDTLTNNFLSQLWTDLEHPPKSYLGYEYAFRKPDGSNNNILWPHIGASGQPYARSIRAQRMRPTSRPDPGVVFDSVLARKEFTPHPNGISSVLFYTASIIIHDCFHTSHDDFAISETSSYLDLAPLYGSNKDQQMAMRTGKDGKLKPDCFSDKRILGFPPGVGVYLIMFNRFHNHVVSHLAKIDENGRFSRILAANNGGYKSTPSDFNLKDGEKTPTKEELYDEALFQTGRLITTGLYVNIVLKDYVRTILNLNRVDSLWNLDPRSDAGRAIFGTKIPEATGNQCSAEFNLVYRWHSCVSERDAKWTEEALKKVVEGKSIANGGDLLKALKEWNEKLPNDPHNRPFDTLKRQPDGRFSDDNLAAIWTASVDDVGGAFGANHVPPILKTVEVLGMMQARSWNLASLNEFRAYFKLQPHKTFESINPDPHVAQQLEYLYGHPDNVEIYPGIVVEGAKKPMKPGSGLCASYTTSRAILADAVALIRSDRFYTVDYTPQNLTNWGFNTAGYDLNINHGCVFYKLVLNAFPNHYSKNSIYAHYPLVIPGENKVILQGMGRDRLYNFDRPVARPPPLSNSSAALGSTALTDSSKFDSLWTQRSVAFGAPAEKAKAGQVSFAEAVMANDKWKSITSAYYEKTLDKLWKEKQYELGGYHQVDVVADVLNAAHIGFITSVLGIPLTEQAKDAKGEKHGLLSIFGEVFEQAFGNPQPNSLSAKIRDAAHWLATTIESQLDGPTTADSKEGELGKSAFVKLAESGSSAKEAAWKDILPTSALILNTLSRLSAQTVEFFLEEKDAMDQAQNLAGASSDDSKASLGKLAQEATRISSNMTVAVAATTKVDVKDDGSTVEAGKGQVVVVNLANAQNDGTSNPQTISLDRDESAYSMKKYGPEVELAYKVTYLCNTAMTAILGRQGTRRVPGPQGRLKKIRDDSGNVQYMNAEESEYVPYPVSLKVRWKA